MDLWRWLMGHPKEKATEEAAIGREILTLAPGVFRLAQAATGVAAIVFGCRSLFAAEFPTVARGRLKHLTRPS
jgi:hypothetical protein